MTFIKGDRTWGSFRYTNFVLASDPPPTPPLQSINQPLSKGLAPPFALHQLYFMRGRGRLLAFPRLPVSPCCTPSCGRGSCAHRPRVSPGTTWQRLCCATTGALTVEGLLRGGPTSLQFCFGLQRIRGGGGGSQQQQNPPPSALVMQSKLLPSRKYGRGFSYWGNLHPMRNLLTNTAMKQRILSDQTPPCHRRPVTAHQCSGRRGCWGGPHPPFGGHLCSIPKVWYRMSYLV